MKEFNCVVEMDIYLWIFRVLSSSSDVLSCCSMGMAANMSEGVLGKKIDGIWHTGVYVFGLEYFYGGGIQKCPPQLVVDNFGIRPVREIDLGSTEIDQATFHEFLETVSAKYTQNTYDLFTNNCNNFSNEVANFLTGSGIPPHIIELPNEVLRTPMGQTFAPMIQAMNQRMQQHMIPLSTPVQMNSSTDSSTSNVAKSAPGPSDAATEEVKYELTVKVSGRTLATHKLTFAEDDPTVLAIKQAIQKETGFAPDDQRVIYSGSLLKDASKKASECGIKSGITIHMSPRVGAVPVMDQPPAATTGAAAPSNGSKSENKTVDAALAEMRRTAEKERKVAFKTLVKIMSNM